MDEKKEVLEYLRNRQRAVEIEAKTDGINVWVLLGAIGIVAWKIVGYFESAIWSRLDVIASVLVLSEAIYLLVFCIAPSGRSRDEVRYAALQFVRSDSPILDVVFGLMLLAPPVLYILSIGFSFQLVFVGLFALAYFVVSLESVRREYFEGTDQPRALPNPEFNPSRQSQFLMSSGIALVLLLVVGLQAFDLKGAGVVVTADDARFLMLVGAFFVLVLILIRRVSRAHKIVWAYDLETDVLLGGVAPREALRQIEHRSLGPLFQDVMSGYIEDLDASLSEVEALLEKCIIDLSRLSAIPPDFQEGRRSEVNKACDPVVGRVDEINARCSALHEYLDRLQSKNIYPNKVLFATVVADLRERSNSHSRRLREIQEKLDQERRNVLG